MNKLRIFTSNQTVLSLVTLPVVNAALVATFCVLGHQSFGTTVKFAAVYGLVWLFAGFVGHLFQFIADAITRPLERIKLPRLFR